MRRTPDVDRKPKEPSVPSPPPPLPPRPFPPALGAQNPTHTWEEFPVYYVYSSPLPHLWLINDARGITPISLGCVIPKSDWGDCKR